MTPTIIVSHAPLFNELNMLSPISRHYRKEYYCVDDGILDIFKKANIICVVHGHHHIPSSMSEPKYVKFVGKEILIICSIFSYSNYGIALDKFLRK